MSIIAKLVTLAVAIHVLINYPAVFYLTVIILAIVIQFIPMGPHTEPVYDSSVRHYRWSVRFRDFLASLKAKHKRYLRWADKPHSSSTPESRQRWMDKFYGGGTHPYDQKS